MMRRLFLAAALTLSVGAYATPPAAVPAANANAATTWHNMVHPVPSGADDATTQTGAAASSSADTSTWHNTTHPLPPGTEASEGKTGVAVNSAADASSDGWHNTVHPVTPGSGSTGSKVRTTSHGGKPHARTHAHTQCAGDNCSGRLDSNPKQN